MADRPAAAILLLRGRIGPILRWARRGPLSLWVVPVGDWTLLSPAEPEESPDHLVEPIAALGGRPIPSRLCPALFLLAQPDHLLLTTQGPRAEPRRWLSWSPGIGAGEVAPRAAATPSTLLQLAGADTPAERAAQRTALRQALAAEHASPAAVAELLLAALNLPGAGFATGQLRPHIMSDAQWVAASTWEMAS
ncbi:MAG: hypothetical protein ACRC0L_03405 [Angustibacter sp.]